MSTPERMGSALARLGVPKAVLAPHRSGGFAVYPNGDRRRRTTLRLSVEQVRTLESDGVIACEGDVYRLTNAGRARLRRESVAPSEAFAAQHRPVVERDVVEAGGELRKARGHDPNAVLRRLTKLTDGAGRPWLSLQEIAAAQALRTGWERAQIGLVRGSDWTAPPKSGSRRGACSAQEVALASRCDAQKRTAAALDTLAAPLRRVVERVCLSEDGLEALERSQGWPARSGKIALKLGLAQLATALGQEAAGNRQ